MKSTQLGNLFGLQMSFIPPLWAGVAFVWIALSLVGFLGFDIPLGESILLGFIGMLLHYVSELIHCLGHAVAAKSTGYPMNGIRFGLFGIFAQTMYPKDEPELPSSTHIRRALGGPIANLIVSIILFFILPLWRGNWYWLGLFVFLDNLITYTLQVFLPVGFNDASTILNELRKIKNKG
jgi:hypothetical protein